MANLLVETLGIMNEFDKTPDDISWIGGESFTFSWEVFKELADVQYDEGYGAPEVATDLVIVFQDSWLERAEHDGAEWWEYKHMPVEPNKTARPSNLTGNSWGTLEAEEQGE